MPAVPAERPSFWLNPRFHLALGLVAVLFGIAAIVIALSGGDDDDALPPVSTTTTLPGNVVSRALNSPAAGVADPEVIAAIRAETDCGELAEMATSARTAGEQVRPEDPRRRNAVLYLTEVQERMAAQNCGLRD